MKLSIVSTFYNSSKTLAEFCKRMQKMTEKVTIDYEIILVDDGSPDNSLAIAKDMQNKNSKIIIVELSRNFGHHRAAMTGLAHAKGDYIFLIDSDLEEAPEYLQEFWTEIHENTDFDVIYGVQKSRKGKAFERMSGSLFFKIFNSLSDIKIDDNACVIRLMTSRYVKSLLLYSEREMAIGGLLKLTGFVQKSFPIDKKSKGYTSYNIRRRINIGINFVTSMTSRPLVYVFYLGITVSTFAFVWFLYLVLQKIIFGVSVSGWSSLIVSIWFLGGITIFCLGVIGMYLSKIFIEVKNRPYSIIKQIHLSHQLYLGNFEKNEVEQVR